MSNDTYRISFSARDTVNGLDVPEGGKVFALVARQPKSSQHVGFATVYQGLIYVYAANGVPVGPASTRKNAAKLIDTFHRNNNADAYWMWAKHTLAV